MKDRLRRIGDFFNVLDVSGNLSITNIGVIVCITKVALAPTVDVASVGALVATLLNYIHKRTNNNA